MFPNPDEEKQILLDVKNLEFIADALSPYQRVLALNACQHIKALLTQIDELNIRNHRGS